MSRKESNPEDLVRKHELSSRRQRMLRGDERRPLPWMWLGLGTVVSIVGIVFAAAIASLILGREPLSVADAGPDIVRLTAPPTSPATATSPAPTVTPLPASTATPQSDNSVAPEVITVGFYGVVTNTGGVGVSVRGGPSTENTRLANAQDNAHVMVIGGPQAGSQYVWWQVRLEDGTEGWIAADFLAPAAAP